MTVGVVGDPSYGQSYSIAGDLRIGQEITGKQLRPTVSVLADEVALFVSLLLLGGVLAAASTGLLGQPLRVAAVTATVTAALAALLVALAATVLLLLFALLSATLALLASLSLLPSLATSTLLSLAALLSLVTLELPLGAALL